MKLTDEQHALLAERLAEVTIKDFDIKDMERMVYDMFLDDFLMMDDQDLLLEAETYEVEVPSVLVT